VPYGRGEPTTGTSMAAGHAPPDPRPTALVVKDIVDGTQTLVRQEIALAQAELMEGLAAKGQAVGLSAAAGVLALFVVGFLGMAGGAALSLVLPAWAAWLIVAGAFLLVLVIFLLVARSRMRAAPLVPQQSITRVKEDLSWAKTLTRR
jgi:hypothetical protein